MNAMNREKGYEKISMSGCIKVCGCDTVSQQFETRKNGVKPSQSEAGLWGSGQYTQTKQFNDSSESTDSNIKENNHEIESDVGKESTNEEIETENKRKKDSTMSHTKKFDQSGEDQSESERDQNDSNKDPEKEELERLMQQLAANMSWHYDPANKQQISRRGQPSPIKGTNKTGKRASKTTKKPLSFTTGPPSSQGLKIGQETSEDSKAQQVPISVLETTTESYYDSIGSGFKDMTSSFGMYHSSQDDIQNPNLLPTTTTEKLPSLFGPLQETFKGPTAPPRDAPQAAISPTEPTTIPTPTYEPTTSRATKQSIESPQGESISRQNPERYNSNVESGRLNQDVDHRSPQNDVLEEAKINGATDQKMDTTPKDDSLREASIEEKLSKEPIQSKGEGAKNSNQRSPRIQPKESTTTPIPDQDEDIDYYLPYYVSLIILVYTWSKFGPNSSNAIMIEKGTGAITRS